MKKVLLTLLVTLGIAGQAVAQDGYIDNSDFPISGWLVVGDNVSIETSDQGNGEISSLSEMYWRRSKFFLAKGSLLVGGAEYITIWSEDGERREPKYPDGYIYFQGDMDGQICERIKKNGLKMVLLYSYIPLEYGNGADYKAENGMSFKIVPFISAAKVVLEGEEYDIDDSGFSDRFKRFLKSPNCYMLMIMSSTGEVEHVELLEKTSGGFENAHHKYGFLSRNEPKVSKISDQGLLLSQWIFYQGVEESSYDTYWAWIKSENALVGVSGRYSDESKYLIPFLKVAK
ncbi:MAG: hypothetical protein IJ352_07535 [Muribaculaceae bacterium]|nr:hypothetical protein [Muribaculaceae bacterium]